MCEVLFAATILLLPLLDSACLADPPGRGANDGPPPQGEPPVQVETDDPRGREQRVLRQVIYRDRQSQTAIDRAGAVLNSGDAATALEMLQQVLDQRSDHFVWVERDRRLSSARREALEVLVAANSKTRDMYDWAYARQAKQLLDSARAAGDPNLIADVMRRFFHTPAGFEATDWLATRWLDRGEYSLAAAPGNCLPETSGIARD